MTTIDRNGITHTYTIREAYQVAMLAIQANVDNGTITNTAAAQQRDQAFEDYRANGGV